MLRAGLIGFPSTGKTTLFRLMTAARDQGRAPHHGKLDAHVGVSRVPDERLDRLTALFNPRRRVPATVEFADVAGSAQAGAKDLLDVAPFRNADALVHVVRLFSDERVPHPAGSVDAGRDVRAMEDELVLADLLVAERRLDRLARDLKKTPSAELHREEELLVTARVCLEEGRPLRSIALGPDDLRRLRGFQFLSGKPLLLVLNLDEADIGRVDTAVASQGLSAFVESAGARAVAVCAKIELEIAELDEGDRTAFLADLGLRESGLDRVIRASSDLLGFVSFFTVGDDECRAWSIPRNTHAQVAAGEIHTDIARGFIRAEVVSYDHLVARGSLVACREHGEVRLEGKDYIVHDGDVINFRFAT
jgi:hypothetical protein